MWKRLITFALTIVTSALIFTARADERMSQVQMALGSTTLSGFVQSGFAFYPPQDAFSTRNRILWGRHQFEFPGFQNPESPSLTPLPPPSLDENALFQSSSFVLTLVDTPVQPVSLPQATDSSAAGAIHAGSDSRGRNNRNLTVSHRITARFSNSTESGWNTSRSRTFHICAWRLGLWNDRVKAIETRQTVRINDL